MKQQQPSFQWTSHPPAIPGQFKNTAKVLLFPLPQGLFLCLHAEELYVRMVGNHSPFSIVKSLLSVQKKLHFTAIGKIWKPSIGLGFRHKRTQDDAFFHLRMEIDNDAIYQIITRISHKHANICSELNADRIYPKAEVGRELEFVEL